MTAHSSEGDDPDDLRQTFSEVGGLLGRKWHLIILSRLQENGPARFNELKREGDISSKVLSDALADLEANGFVAREVVDERPIRVEYRLAERGASFGRVLWQIRRWHRDEQDAAGRQPAPPTVADANGRSDRRTAEALQNGRG